ncbi:hypothetical protein KKF84_21165 [Myxococcota bacterium]|nr:hypothetical protein [Myxococcota bacterium]MBU1537837.1 hypothetical protein [Myxococcota bacterium]
MRSTFSQKRTMSARIFPPIAFAAMLLSTCVVTTGYPEGARFYPVHNTNNLVLLERLEVQTEYPVDEVINSPLQLQNHLDRLVDTNLSTSFDFATKVYIFAYAGFIDDIDETAMRYHTVDGESSNLVMVVEGESVTSAPRLALFIWEMDK